MRHKFKPSQLNVVKCMVCDYDMLAHLATAKCEACSNVGKCDVVNQNGKTILLCETCEESNKDLGIISDGPRQIDYNLPDSAKVEQISKLVTADLPQNGSEFFNAKMVGIIELEKKINADDAVPVNKKHFFFAEQLQFRNQLLTKALFSTMELQLEIRSEQAAISRSLNALVSRLRTEEREALKLKYTEYTPSKAPIKVSVPRQSAEDKTIEGVAKLMFAPRDDKNIVQWEALTKEERDACLNKARIFFRGNKKQVTELPKVPKSE